MIHKLSAFLNLFLGKKAIEPAIGDVVALVVIDISPVQLDVVINTNLVQLSVTLEN